MGLTIRSVNKIEANPLATGVKVNPLNYLNQQLRVAAYCRVSTEFEEQQSSFETQVNFYTEYINAIPNGSWFRSMPMMVRVVRKSIGEMDS